MRTKLLTEMKRRARGLLLALMLLGLPVLGISATFVSVSIAPPALPVYLQPAIPGPGYIWTPGYWAYGAGGYYWVPGTWILPPYVGGLWTPGYWGWRGGFYVWNPGYWGRHVGFYGGINYGFGYVGVGYLGGYWNNGAFFYNRSVNNVNVTNIHNTYNTVVNNARVTRVSYNGGPRGIGAQPTATEREALNEGHVAATQTQMQHEQAAAGNRALLFSENHGRPSIAATPQPGEFNHPGVVAARGYGARQKSMAQGNPNATHMQHAQGMAQEHPHGHAQNGKQGHPPAAHEGGERRGEGQHRQAG
jgi:hypothetical protein